VHDANDGAAYTTPALAFDVIAFAQVSSLIQTSPLWLLSE
jgi:hypothetical protein